LPRGKTKTAQSKRLRTGRGYALEDEWWKEAARSEPESRRTATKEPASASMSRATAARPGLSSFPPFQTKRGDPRGDPRAGTPWRNHSGPDWRAAANRCREGRGGSEKRSSAGRIGEASRRSLPSVRPFVCRAPALLRLCAVLLLASDKLMGSAVLFVKEI
jgi:hypothetical protein